MGGPMKYSSSSRTGWAAELLVTFAFGFLLATLLWLGLWFFHTRPAQATALRAKETALRAKETALVNCVALQDHRLALKDTLQAEIKQIDAKLKEALKGWGDCIRSKTAPDGQEKPEPNTP